MSDEKVGEVEPKRFEEIIHSFAQRGFEEMPVDTFFEALALRDESDQEEIIEILGELVDGKLILSIPTATVASIDVQDNVILIDKRKIVVNLKS